MVRVLDLDLQGSTVIRDKIIFATYAARESELNNVCILARSLRAFGGTHEDSPFGSMCPADAESGNGALVLQELAATSALP